MRGGMATVAERTGRVLLTLAALLALGLLIANSASAGSTPGFARSVIFPVSAPAPPA